MLSLIQLLLDQRGSEPTASHKPSFTEEAQLEKLMSDAERTATNLPAPVGGAYKSHSDRPFVVFRSEVEQTLTQRHCGDRVSFCYIMRHLGEGPRDFLNEASSSDADYQNAISEKNYQSILVAIWKLLTAEYQHQSSTTKLCTGFYNLQQGSKEKVSDYIVRLDRERRLLERDTRRPLTQGELIAKLCTSIRHPLRKQVADRWSRVQSYTELKENLVDHEIAQGMLLPGEGATKETAIELQALAGETSSKPRRHAAPPPQVDPSATELQAFEPRPKARTQDQWCLRCYEYGHFATYCEKEKIADVASRCARCGLPGHTEKNCRIAMNRPCGRCGEKGHRASICHASQFVNHNCPKNCRSSVANH